MLECPSSLLASLPFIRYPRNVRFAHIHPPKGIGNEQEQDTKDEESGQKQKTKNKNREQLACAKGLGLHRECDFDVVDFLILLEDGDHDLGSVVDSQDDISNASLKIQCKTMQVWV